MPTNFPSSLDSFTTKVDGVDRVMASHVNNLQDAVVALETQLGAPPLGWHPISATPTYVGATSFTIPGDWTAILKLGVKIRLVNSTTKYGYVLSSSYSSPNTTVNLVPNTSYSLAAGAISELNVSYANPPDFPGWLGWTPTVSYAGGTTDPTSLVINWARFSMDGRKSTAAIKGTLTKGAGNRTYISVTLPINVAFVNSVGLATITFNGTIAVGCQGFGANPSVLSIGAFTMATDGFLFASIICEI